MNAELGLDHWLDLPAMRPVAPALREVLRAAAATLDPARCTPAAPAQLADTLSLL